MIVVDASVVVELLLQTANANRIADRLFTDGQTLHAPQLLDVEVVQVLRRYALQRDIDEIHGASLVALLRELPIARHSHDALLSRVWALRANVTAYDATYLALAEGMSAPLLTCDRKLGRSHGSSALVEVI